MTMKSLLNGESTLLPINYQDYPQQNQDNNDPDLRGGGGGYNGMN